MSEIHRIAKELESHDHWELMTPQRAESLMAFNVYNRRQKNGAVERMARDMKEGNWRHNPAATIVMGWSDGKRMVVDGQHRLLAIIMSGVSIQMRVSELPADMDGRLAQEVIDNGGAGVRTVGGMLALRQVTSAALVAAVAKFVLRWNWKDGGFTEFKPSPPEILAYALSKNEEIQRAVRVGSQAGTRIGINRGTMARVAYLCARFDDARCDEFFELLGTGAGLPPKSPILVARNSYSKMAGKNPSEEWVRNLLIGAWNEWVKTVGGKRSQIPVVVTASPDDQDEPSKRTVRAPTPRRATASA